MAFIAVIIGIVVLIALVILLSISCGKHHLGRFDENHITLTRLRKSTSVPWSDILAFFHPTGYSGATMERHRFLALETVNNEEFEFFIRNKDMKQTFEKLYEFFYKNLIRNMPSVDNIEFSHPKRWFKRKTKIRKTLPILFIVMVGVGIIRFLQVGFIASDPTFPILGILALTSIVYYVLLKKRKCYKSLKIYGDKLVSQDEYGHSESHNLSKVKTFKLEKTVGLLKFTDGTKLMDLEKLRYWPLLREHLLSKLEHK